MPARGRKPAPKMAKAARKTLQPSRDGISTLKQAKVVDGLIAEAELSIVPPQLPDNVAEVWADYVEVARSNGAKQCDADSFAEWCTMAARLRTARMGDLAAPASYIAQFRMLGELFGLAGPGSRVVSQGVEAAKTNPFARNGRR